MRARYFNGIRMGHASVALLLVALFGSQPAIGGATLDGDEFQVNTYITGDQAAPGLAVNPDGSFVVVWRNNRDTDRMDKGTDDFSIEARLYDASGAAVGGELTIVDPMSLDIDFNTVDVGADGAGNFVVVYERGSQDPGIFEVMARRYTAAGDLIGAEFQVNSYTTGGQRGPSVGVDADGTFLVSWWSTRSGTTMETDRSIQGQFFDGFGDMIGSQFQINTYTTGDQKYPLVAARDGDFIVVWTSDGGPGDPNRSVQGRRYDVNGPLASEFRVNEKTNNEQMDPSVAIDSSGDFTAVWFSDDTTTGGDGDGSSIRGRRFDLNGDAIGAEFQVNTNTLGDQERPKVTYGANGEFIVVWTSPLGPGPDADGSVQGQRFDADGVLIGSQFQVNTSSMGNQEIPQYGRQVLGAADNGEFVVVWQSDAASTGDDDSLFSIQGQRFLPVLPDRDEDGVPDDLDNCPDDPNPAQTNVCREVAGRIDTNDLIVVNPLTSSVILVDREDGAQIAVTDMPVAGVPLGVAIDRTLGVYVTQSVDPKILRVDSFTGEESRVTFSASPIGSAYDLAYRRSDDLIFFTDTAPAVMGRSLLFVAASGNFSDDVPLQTPLNDPRGVEVDERDDSLVVIDATLGVLRVESASGAVAVISSGQMLVNPDGVAIAPGGTLFVADRDASGGSGAVISINPASGAQTLLSSNGTSGDEGVSPNCPGGAGFSDPRGISLDFEGNLFVTDGARVLKVDRESGFRTCLTEGEALAQTAGIATVPMIVTDSFEAEGLQDDLVGQDINSEMVFAVRDMFGDVVVSARGTLVAGTEIRTENDNQFWALMAEPPQAPVDLSEPFLIADIPGMTAPGEDSAGPFAELFADGPVDLRDFTFSAKLRVTGSAAQSANGGSTTNAEVTFEVVDADGNTGESAPMPLTQSFLTQLVDVNEQDLPSGGAFDVDYSQLAGAFLNFTSTSAASEDTEVAVDDVTLVPELSRVLLQLASFAVLSLISGRRRGEGALAR